MHFPDMEILPTFYILPNAAKRLAYDMPKQEGEAGKVLYNNGIKDTDDGGALLTIYCFGLMLMVYLKNCTSRNIEA